ncbi:acyl carrier protein [Halobacteriovorax marinus]|uniref:Acyl carrier protein n=1 Tax=Halobacteriovorax marinus TaxID=97084 RepID=A0A1Y5FBA4_9BACT|nr:acyl carrier protein [Halobacteriovorax marinus]
MSKQEVMDELQELFRDIFDDEDLILSEGTNSNEVEEWDSLNHINLVIAIERKFNIKFALGEIQSLKDVGEMVDMMIAKHL